jgi:hypothetical protein
VLAQYALFDLVRAARLVWGGLLELAVLVPEGELGDGALAAGSEVVRDTPRLAAAMGERLASAERREQLHRLIARLLDQGHDVLGRWADVMVSSGTYAEIVDRHVELYSRLYWWRSVLDESDPLELAMRIVPLDWWQEQLPDRPSTAENLGPRRVCSAASVLVRETRASRLSVGWSVAVSSCLARSSGRSGMKVNGELDRSRSGAEKPGRTKVRKQPSHGPVIGQHERRELADALVPGPVGQPMQERLADPAALPGFEDSDRDLRPVTPFAIADVAGDANAVAAA